MARTTTEIRPEHAPAFRDERTIKIVLVVTLAELSEGVDPVTPSDLETDVVELLEGMSAIADVRSKAQYGE